MAGPPVGSAMPARHSTTRRKGGAQARQTRRGNEPRPQHKHSAKIPIKNKVSQSRHSIGTFRHQELEHTETAKRAHSSSETFSLCALTMDRHNFLTEDESQVSLLAGQDVQVSYNQRKKEHVDEDAVVDRHQLPNDRKT